MIGLALILWFAWSLIETFVKPDPKPTARDEMNAVNRKLGIK